MSSAIIESKTTQDAVVCPSCGHPETVYTWDLLEASANPEQAERLASGALFVHVCSKCSAAIPLDYPLFYVDRVRKVSAYYPAGTGELDAISTAFRQATIKFRGIDLGGLRRGQYAMRVVPERHQLVEKVAIWHAGLDDRLLEVLKCSLLDELNGRDGGLKFEDAQFIGTVDDGDKLEFMLFEPASPTDGETGDAPEARGIAVPMLAYRRLENSVDIGANIDLDHSPIVDRAWGRRVLDAARADAGAQK